MKLIPLTQGQFAKVDDEDFERFGRMGWNAIWNPYTKSFYASRNSKRPDGRNTTLYLHRHILGSPHGMQIDHKSHDTLDDQRSNLRICTRSQNGGHRKGLPGHNESGIRGVSWYKPHGKWLARIMVQRRAIFLGYFSDKNEAARAYASANKKYFGEFGGVLHV